MMNKREARELMQEKCSTFGLGLTPTCLRLHGHEDVDEVRGRSGTTYGIESGVSADAARDPFGRGQALVAGEGRR